MNKPIRTYEDLVEERERLEQLLVTQKESLRLGVQSLKSEFKPALAAISFLGSLVTRDRVNPVLGTAANTAIDLLLKNTLLGRAGWLVRNLVPAMVKNLSSHYIHDHEDTIFRKIFSLFGNRKRKRARMSKPEKTNGELTGD
ncbi:MAG TPA: hypothetical protein VFX58_19570 [Chitinophagaceae bacterium]|nr:hypothetical protein [Chitinophagaceae bacterium]